MSTRNFETFRGVIITVLGREEGVLQAVEATENEEEITTGQEANLVLKKDHRFPRGIRNSGKDRREDNGQPQFVPVRVL